MIMTNEEYTELYNEFTEGKKELIEKFFIASNKLTRENNTLPKIFQSLWMVYHPDKSNIVNGMYLTARIQVGGCICTMLNEYKDGEWQGRCLDGGYIIAYKEITKEEFRELIIKNL
jgi:hypothetical protein